MMWGVLYPHNPNHGPPFVLEEEVITVGSSRCASWCPPPCAVALAYLSRKHFQLDRDPCGKVFVTSLSQQNATFLNGRRLVPGCRVPVEPDVDNARHQLSDCFVDAPIIFTVVPNKTQALKRPRLAEGYVGFTLTLTAQAPRHIPDTHTSVQSDAPALTRPSKESNINLPPPVSATISVDSAMIFRGTRLLIVPVGLTSVWLTTLVSRVLKLGGELTDELSQATHVVLEKTREPKHELPRLQALPLHVWPPIHTEEWISESSRAKRLLIGRCLHPLSLPLTHEAGSQSPSSCSSCAASQSGTLIAKAPISSAVAAVDTHQVAHALSITRDRSLELSAPPSRVSSTAQAAPLPELDETVGPSAIVSFDATGSDGGDCSASTTDDESRSPLEVIAFRLGLTVKQLILEAFERLEAAYQAGANRGQMAPMRAGGTDPRQYHYMQFASTLQLLPDYPSWDDIERLRHKAHGFGAKSLAKLRELWETGRLRRAEAINDLPEQVAAQKLIKVHGIGQSTAVALAREGVTSIEQLRARDDLSEQTRIWLKYSEELQTRIPRSDVAEVEAQVARVANMLDARLDAIVCGSYRRRKESSHDIDVLLILRGVAPGDTRHQELMIQLIPALHEAKLLTDDLTSPSMAVLGRRKGVRSSTPSLLKMKNAMMYMGICLVGGLHRRIDLRCYPEYQEAAALLHWTGSAQFNRFMSRVANERGFTLSEFGMQPSIKRGPAERVPMGDYLELRTEADIFDVLQLEYKEPWERRDKRDVVDKRTGQPYFMSKQ